MTRPICTWMMPASHLQPFVHSLTKLCRHTTLVQQCLSNGHQQISQCLSYTELEDCLKARAYLTPKSSWKEKRILNHLVKTPASPFTKVKKNVEKNEENVHLFCRHKGEKHVLCQRYHFYIYFHCENKFCNYRILLKVAFSITK